MSKEVQKLRRNKYEIFNLYFTSYTSNLMKGDQAQYGLLKNDSKYTWSFYLYSLLWYFKLFEQEV